MSDSLNCALAATQANAPHGHLSASGEEAQSNSVSEQSATSTPVPANSAPQAGETAAASGASPEPRPCASRDRSITAAALSQYCESAPHSDSPVIPPEVAAAASPEADDSGDESYDDEETSEIAELSPMVARLVRDAVRQQSSAHAALWAEHDRMCFATYARLERVEYVEAIRSCLTAHRHAAGPVLKLLRCLLRLHRRYASVVEGATAVSTTTHVDVKRAPWAYFYGLADEDSRLVARLDALAQAAQLKCELYQGLCEDCGICPRTQVADEFLALAYSRPAAHYLALVLDWTLAFTGARCQWRPSSLTAQRLGLLSALLATEDVSLPPLPLSPARQRILDLETPSVRTAANKMFSSRESAATTSSRDSAATTAPVEGPMPNTFIHTVHTFNQFNGSSAPPAVPATPSRKRQAAGTTDGDITAPRQKRKKKIAPSDGDVPSAQAKRKRDSTAPRLPRARLLFPTEAPRVAVTLSAEARALLPDLLTCLQLLYDDCVQRATADPTVSKTMIRQWVTDEEWRRLRRAQLEQSLADLASHVGTAIRIRVASLAVDHVRAWRTRQPLCASAQAPSAWRVNMLPIDNDIRRGRGAFAIFFHDAAFAGDAAQQRLPRGWIHCLDNGKVEFQDTSAIAKCHVLAPSLVQSWKPLQMSEK